MNIGDEVQLKSGGPRMTVTAIHEGGDVSCSWFDDKGNRQGGSFPQAALRIAPEIPRGPRQAGGGGGSNDPNSWMR